jgi:hypothetical protein
MQARLFWSLWQELLLPFASCFTTPGWKRFVEWVTGLALNVEEHTITQSVLALNRPDDWKALETFAETGAWETDEVEDTLARLLETAPGRLWHGFRVDAVDDTKVHRSSKDVWGTCTFHEYTARCPNRAGTVRAHNWVVLGAVLHNGDRPGGFLPLAGRLSFRKSQLPPSSDGRSSEPFHTKCEWVVELLQQEARTVDGPHLGVIDGGFAFQSVIRPLVLPEAGQPRVDILTRLRRDARLYALPPKERRPSQKGPDPKWGRRLPPPRRGGQWSVPWQQGRAFVYGRMRTVRWKEILCLWWVSGHEVVVKAVVAEVEGYRKRFTLVTSAVGLTGLQMVELFAARFRQEDGFRDLKQRLGWEECRAWTQNPIVRTSQAQWVTLSLLQLLQLRLESLGETEWWFRPPWNRKKDHPSVLDVERLLREHRGEIQQLLSEWLGDEQEAVCGGGQPMIA